ncbi:ArnT family glycosyltransferase [Ktedonobacter racemifer]|uniref:Glycosyl transferase family 39 n=1 Tax=Ktedonobacter racemifer DSM 44963 TaxID=485913 RepID=D6TK31_KTERA|nr:glycosyltransferase family 39 protein [Ktedonobacter racemifer]EFH89788.1 glycosyl transferase family 39 [Ktedonobacter racemifer DSM 44963]
MQMKNMSFTTHRQGDTSAQDVGQRETVAPTRTWHRIALALIVVIAAFLNFFQQQQNGYGNQFYAAAVRSMLDSWHNFFFVAFDPAGFVTVDKPPLGLWIQTASAAIFGFSGFSIILPQSVAGILSVLVLYWLVRRKFGPVMGLLAALFLALTPISVAMNRDNNLDMLLVLFVLLATWAVSLAAETGRLRWLLLGALLIAFGFNVKTLEAYLVIPALGLLYLLTAPLSWRKRILHLVLATLIMLIVSFSWIVAVDMVPASQRPYVDSTSDNSELSLTLGYNGIQRLLGTSQAGGGSQPGTTDSRSTSVTPPTSTSQPPFPGRLGNGGGTANGLRGGAGNGGGTANIFNGGGPASPLRFFNVDLGGQVSWLLPMAILGLLALLWQRRVSFPLDNRLQASVLWGVWLLTMGTFFSIASFFHTYYMVIIAPAIAALAAIGLVTLWNDYRMRADWRGWILPLALLLTAGEQLYLLSSSNSWNTVLSPIVLILTILSAAVLVFARLRPTLIINSNSWLRSAIVAGVAVLLITPAIWSFTTTLHPENTTLPTAGPSTMGGMMAFPGADGGSMSSKYRTGSFSSTDSKGRAGGPPAGFGGMGMGGGAASDQKLIDYLTANQGTARYLLATIRSTSAESIIVQTNKPVMALGGYLGSDPILTQSQLTSLIKDGTVRYFLLQSPGNPNTTTDASPTQASGPTGTGQMRGNGGGGLLGAGQNQQLTGWVQSHCSIVQASLWSTSSTQSNTAAGGGSDVGGQQLYDCSSLH